MSLWVYSDYAQIQMHWTSNIDKGIITGHLSVVMQENNNNNNNNKN